VSAPAGRSGSLEATLDYVHSGDRACGPCGEREPRRRSGDDDGCSAGLRPVLHFGGPQAAVATPAPEAAQGVHHGSEERSIDGADDPTGAPARKGSRPRPTTARVGPDREAEDVTLLLGLSGHRDPRRTYTASARRPTLPAVLNVVQWMARFPVLGDLPRPAGSGGPTAPPASQLP